MKEFKGTKGNWNAHIKDIQEDQTRGSTIRRSTASSRRYSGQWTPSMGTPF